MTQKEPVLLTLLIETARLRWFVGSVGLDGAASPLLCSHENNLDTYLGQEFDEQASFLRHRLSGALQRGCDRLWGQVKKPCQIAFVADGPFLHADTALTPRVAEHFVEWMVNPPVVFFVRESSNLSIVAGAIEPSLRQALEQGLPALWHATQQLDRWELIPRPKKC